MRWQYPLQHNNPVKVRETRLQNFAPALSRPWGLTTIVLSMGLMLASSANADPQFNAGLTVGPGLAGRRGKFWDHAEFHAGLRADVMLLREKNRDFGVGPYFDVGTYAFDELQFGGGVSALVPIHEDLPLVFSVGPYARWGDDAFGVEPGLSGSIFWGSRSYNFHNAYGVTAGLLIAYKQSLGNSQESVLSIAAQVDLAVLALPIIGLINLAKGPSHDAREIEK